jgi:hypothetical protein
LEFGEGVSAESRPHASRIERAKKLFRVVAFIGGWAGLAAVCAGGALVGLLVKNDELFIAGILVLGVVLLVPIFAVLGTLRTAIRRARGPHEVHMRPGDELGPILASRSAAADLRRRLEERIAGADEAVIDFERVVTISPSFADEFIAKLPPGARVEVLNLCDDLRALIDSVTARRAETR